MRTTGKAVIYFLSLGVAAYATLGYLVMPLGSLVHPDMKAAFVAHPVAVYLHVFSAAVALLLGPFQFSARLRRARIHIHRWVGRLYLFAGVLMGGLSGLYLAQFAYGGFVARLGFATLAVCWLYTGSRAFLAIRRKAIDEHEKWIVRNFSLTFAAVTLRIYVPLSVAAGADFAIAYPIIAWLCWLPNLLLSGRLYKALRSNPLRRREPAPSRPRSRIGKSEPR
jgi:uncharacterized membrane protein